MVTTMTTPPEQSDVPVSRQQALNSRVLLLAPVLGWWHGRYQLPKKKTKVTTDGEEAENADTTVPCAVLMTDKYPLNRDGKPYKKILQSIDSTLGAAKEKYTLKFNKVAGVRITPKNKGAEFMAELYGLTLGKLRRQLKAAIEVNDYAITDIQRQIDAVLIEEGEHAPDTTPVFDIIKGDKVTNQSIAYRMHAVGKEFSEDWARIRAEIASKSSTFKHIEYKVPPAVARAAMRDKFYLDVVPIELAGQTDSNKLTAGDLDDHSAAVRAACERQATKAIDAMVAAPRQELATALASLHSLVERDGRVNSRSFNRVSKAIAKIRMFDCVANDALLEKITQLETRLGNTEWTELNRETSESSGFSTALNSVMTEVADEMKIAEDQESFGRNYRSIDF